MNFVRRSRDGTARIVRDNYGPKWYTIRRLVALRDEHCVECRAPGDHVHHIVPLSRGGTTTMANLVFLCVKCHQRKHNHL